MVLPCAHPTEPWLEILLCFGHYKIHANMGMEKGKREGNEAAWASAVKDWAAYNTY